MQKEAICHQARLVEDRNSETTRVGRDWGETGWSLDLRDAYREEKRSRLTAGFACLHSSARVLPFGGGSNPGAVTATTIQARV